LNEFFNDDRVNDGKSGREENDMSRLSHSTLI
jgi:hypothetical protein